MDFQFKKNVRVVVDLEIGDKVVTDGYGYQLDGKVHTIEDIKPNLGGCSSGILVKISGYHSYIDSDWVDKISQ